METNKTAEDSPLNMIHTSKRCEYFSHAGTCVSPELASETQAILENIDTKAQDQHLSTKHQYTPSVRDYVQRLHDATKAVFETQHSELQPLLNTLLTKAVESGYLLAQNQHQDTSTSLPPQARSGSKADLENQLQSPEPKKCVNGPSLSVFMCYLLVGLPGVLGGPLLILSALSSGDLPPFHGHYGAVILSGYCIGWTSHVGTHLVSMEFNEPHARALVSGFLVLFCTLFFTMYLGPFDK